MKSMLLFMMVVACIGPILSSLTSPLLDIEARAMCSGNNKCPNGYVCCWKGPNQAPKCCLGPQCQASQTINNKEGCCPNTHTCQAETCTLAQTECSNTAKSCCTPNFKCQQMINGACCPSGSKCSSYDVDSQICCSGTNHCCVETKVNNVWEVVCSPVYPDGSGTLRCPAKTKCSVIQSVCGAPA